MYPFLWKTYQHFLKFLRRPDDRSFARVGLSFKIKTLIGLFVLNVFLSGLWLLGLSLSGLKNLENVNSNLMDLSYGMLILIGVIIVPFVEEFLFRFPMKYSRNYLLQFFIAIVALFAPAVSKSSIYANARTYWKRFFWIFFYGLTSAFAFIHIYNFVDAKQLMLWSPLLTLTQFFTGLILGYVRVRFGFLWSWAYHGFFNFFFFSLAFLPGNQPKQMDLETFMEKQTIRKDTMTVRNPDVTSYLFTSADCRLNIQKSSDTITVFSGYYGVTPDSIYFEQCTLERILRVLTKDSITLLGSKDVRYDIEMKRLKPGKKNLTSKEILVQQLTQEFSLK